MAYTWEEVMLNIDVRNEAEAERKEQQKILDKQTSEQTAMGLWSLGLSLVGGALFGPAGYAAGKIAGRGIGDIRNTWEADAAALDTGKFYKREGEDFKRIKKAEASDQTSGQIVQGVTDLAMMYVQAGGLQEGPTDLTTFGSGGVEGGEWSVRGKTGGPTIGESVSTLAPGPGGDMMGPLRQVDLTPVTFESDIPSLLSGWNKEAGWLSNLKPVGKKLQSANTGVNTLNTLYQSFLSSEDEKATG